MLGTNYPQQEMVACKPDPEERLQVERERIECLLRADEIIMELISMPIHISVPEMITEQMLGSIALQLHRAKREEQRWLDEINK